MSKPRQARTRRPAPTRRLTPRAAAAILGVHPDTLALWCEDGKHPGLERAFVRLPSGQRRYSESVIAAYADGMSGAA